MDHGALSWAWLAGVFEGEGSITFTGRSSVTLHIGMTDEDVIQRVAAVAAVGWTTTEDRGDKRKRMYVWRVTTAADVAAVLGRLRPWLGDRRGARADAALERVADVRKPGHCKRDHPLTGDNLYRSPGGQEHCRACARIRDAARRDLIKT